MQTLQFLPFLKFEAKLYESKSLLLNSLKRMACYWEDLAFFFKKNCWNILENLQVPKVLKKRMLLYVNQQFSDDTSHIRKSKTMLTLPPPSGLRTSLV